MTVREYDGSTFAEVSQVGRSDGSVFSDSSVNVRRSDGTWEEIWPSTPASLVSRWSFDSEDINSGTLIDTVGSNDGAITGMSTVAGIYPHESGDAGDFDGTDDNVDFGVIPELDGVSTFSLAVWLNLDAVNTGGDQLLIGAYPNVDNAIRFSEANGQLRCLVENDGTRAFDDGGTITADTTHSAVLTYDGDEVIGYLDGSQVLSATGGPTTTPSLNIYAAKNESGPAFTDGTLDDGRLYDKALTATEVSNLHNTGRIDG